MKADPMRIIYELTLSERYFRSEGKAFSNYFFRPIHNVSSMSLSGSSYEDIIAYLKVFFSEVIKDDSYFERFLKRINYRSEATSS